MPRCDEAPQPYQSLPSFPSFVGPAPPRRGRPILGERPHNVCADLFEKRAHKKSPNRGFSCRRASEEGLVHAQIGEEGLAAQRDGGGAAGFF